METRSERTKKNLEDKLLALTGQVSKLCLLFDHFIWHHRNRTTREFIQELETTVKETRTVFELKKHEPLPEWEMTMAQVKRCLDAQMPDQADELFGRLLLGPPGRLRWLP